MSLIDHCRQRSTLPSATIFRMACRSASLWDTWRYLQVTFRAHYFWMGRWYLPPSAPDAAQKCRPKQKPNQGCDLGNIGEATRLRAHRHKDTSRREVVVALRIQRAVDESDGLKDRVELGRWGILSEIRREVLLCVVDELAEGEERSSPCHWTDISEAYLIGAHFLHVFLVLTRSSRDNIDSP